MIARWALAFAVVALGQTADTTPLPPVPPSYVYHADPYPAAATTTTTTVEKLPVTS